MTLSSSVLPLIAACALIASCGASAVAPPRIAQPGDSIQHIVDLNPPGAEITIAAGVHEGASIRPKSGQRFVGEEGAVLDGQDRVEFAFFGERSVDSVHVEGLEIRNYASPVQWAAVRGIDTDGWTVIGNDIHHNTGGVRIGSGMRVIDNHIHHNRQTGIMGQGQHVLIAGNDISDNNGDLFFDPDDHPEDYEAGGIKLTYCDDVVIRDNVIRRNGVTGVWIDLDVRGVLIENNVIEDNIHHGVFYEISYDGVIRGNYIAGNGTESGKWYHHGGVVVATSGGVEVVDNQIIDNGMGVIGSQIDRGKGRYGLRLLTGLSVHGNVIRQQVGVTGVVKRRFKSGSVFDDTTISFQGNEYTLGSNDRYFRWRDNDLTVEEWMAFGHDSTGTFTR